MTPGRTRSRVCLNIFVFLSGISLLWFSVYGDWLGILKLVGLAHELHRSRVTGDLAALRGVSTALAVVLMVTPLVAWRFRESISVLSRKISNAALALENTPFLVPFCLSLLILAKTLFQVALHISGYAAYSADDFGRTLGADTWLRNGYSGWREWLQLGSPWLPFPNFLFGFALAFHRDLYVTPKIVNLVLSAASTVVMYALGRALFGRMAGLATTAIFAFVPWHVWLGISGMTSDLPSTIIIALFGFFLYGWLEQKKPRDVLFAGACLLIGTGIRYENWFFAAVFSIVVVITVALRWRQGSLTQQSAIFAFGGLFLANIFPLVHVIASYVFLNDLLPAMRATDSFVIDRPISKINLLVLTVVSFPLELILISAGIIIAHTWRERSATCPYLIVILGTLLAFIISFAGKLPAHGAGVSRVLLPYVALLLPYAGFTLTSVLKRSLATRYAALLGSVIVIILFTFNIARTANYRDTFPKEAIHTGWALRTLESLGTVAPDARILLEESEGKHWGHLGIMVVANRPERFVVIDRDELRNSSPERFQKEGCGGPMGGQPCKLGVLWSPEAIKKFQEIYHGRAWQIGRYRIFELDSSFRSTN